MTEILHKIIHILVNIQKEIEELCEFVDDLVTYEEAREIHHKTIKKMIEDAGH